MSSEYLQAEDLLVNRKYVTAKVTISEFIPGGTVRGQDTKLIQNPMVAFQGKAKRLILNKTNQSVLHVMTGLGVESGAQWVGHQIVLHPRIIPGNMLAIRIIPPNGTPLRKGVIKHLGEPAVWSGAVPHQVEWSSRVNKCHSLDDLRALHQQFQDVDGIPDAEAQAIAGLFDERAAELEAGSGE